MNFKVSFLSKIFQHCMLGVFSLSNVLSEAAYPIYREYLSPSSTLTESSDEPRILAMAETMRDLQRTFSASSPFHPSMNTLRILLFEKMSPDFTDLILNLEQFHSDPEQKGLYFRLRHSPTWFQYAPSEAHEGVFSGRPLLKGGIDDSYTLSEGKMDFAIPEDVTLNNMEESVSDLSQFLTPGRLVYYQGQKARVDSMDPELEMFRVELTLLEKGETIRIAYRNRGEVVHISLIPPSQEQTLQRLDQVHSLPQTTPGSFEVMDFELEYAKARAQKQALLTSLQQEEIKSESALIGELNLVDRRLMQISRAYWLSRAFKEGQAFVPLENRYQPEKNSQKIVSVSLEVNEQDPSNFEARVRLDDQTLSVHDFLRNYSFQDSWMEAERKALLLQESRYTARETNTEWNRVLREAIPALKARDLNPGEDPVPGLLADLNALTPSQQSELDEIQELLIQGFLRDLEDLELPRRLSHSNTESLKALQLTSSDPLAPLNRSYATEDEFSPLIPSYLQAKNTWKPASSPLENRFQEQELFQNALASLVDLSFLEHPSSMPLPGTTHGVLSRLGESKLGRILSTAAVVSMILPPLAETQQALQNSDPGNKTASGPKKKEETANTTTPKTTASEAMKARQKQLEALQNLKKSIENGLSPDSKRLADINTRMKAIQETRQLEEKKNPPPTGLQRHQKEQAELAKQRKWESPVTPPSQALVSLSTEQKSKVADPLIQTLKQTKIKNDSPDLESETVDPDAKDRLAALKELFLRRWTQFVKSTEDQFENDVYQVQIPDREKRQELFLNMLHSINPETVWNAFLRSLNPENKPVHPNLERLKKNNSIPRILIDAWVATDAVGSSHKEGKEISYMVLNFPYLTQESQFEKTFVHEFFHDMLQSGMPPLFEGITEWMTQGTLSTMNRYDYTGSYMQETLTAALVMAIDEEDWMALYRGEMNYSELERSFHKHFPRMSYTDFETLCRELNKDRGQDLLKILTLLKGHVDPAALLQKQKGNRLSNHSGLAYGFWKQGLFGKDPQSNRQGAKAHLLKVLLPEALANTQKINSLALSSIALLISELLSPEESRTWTARFAQKNVKLPLVIPTAKKEAQSLPGLDGKTNVPDQISNSLFQETGASPSEAEPQAFPPLPAPPDPEEEDFRNRLSLTTDFLNQHSTTSSMFGGMLSDFLRNQNSYYEDHVNAFYQHLLKQFKFEGLSPEAQELARWKLKNRTVSAFYEKIPTMAAWEKTRSLSNLFHFLEVQDFGEDVKILVVKMALQSGFYTSSWSEDIGKYDSSSADIANLLYITRKLITAPDSFPDSFRVRLFEIVHTHWKTIQKEYKQYRTSNFDMKRPLLIETHLIGTHLKDTALATLWRTKFLTPEKLMDDFLQSYQEPYWSLSVEDSTEFFEPFKSVSSSSIPPNRLGSYVEALTHLEDHIGRVGSISESLLENLKALPWDHGRGASSDPLPKIAALTEFYKMSIEDPLRGQLLEQAWASMDSALEAFSKMEAQSPERARFLKILEAHTETLRNLSQLVFLGSREFQKTIHEKTLLYTLQIPDPLWRLKQIEPLFKQARDLGLPIPEEQEKRFLEDLDNPELSFEEHRLKSRSFFELSFSENGKKRIVTHLMREVDESLKVQMEHPPTEKEGRLEIDDDNQKARDQMWEIIFLGQRISLPQQTLLFQSLMDHFQALKDDNLKLTWTLNLLGQTDEKSVLKKPLEERVMLLLTEGNIRPLTTFLLSEFAGYSEPSRLRGYLSQLGKNKKNVNPELWKNEPKSILYLYNPDLIAFLDPIVDYRKLAQSDFLLLNPEGLMYEMDLESSLSVFGLFVEIWRHIPDASPLKKDLTRIVLKRMQDPQFFKAFSDQDGLSGISIELATQHSKDFARELKIISQNWPREKEKQWFASYGMEKLTQAYLQSKDPAYVEILESLIQNHGEAMYQYDRTKIELNENWMYAPNSIWVGLNAVHPTVFGARTPGADPKTWPKIWMEEHLRKISEASDRIKLEASLLYEDQDTKGSLKIRMIKIALSSFKEPFFQEKLKKGEFDAGALDALLDWAIRESAPLDYSQNPYTDRVETKDNLSTVLLDLLELAQYSKDDALKARGASLVFQQNVPASMEGRYQQALKTLLPPKDGVIPYSEAIHELAKNQGKHYPSNFAAAYLKKAVDKAEAKPSELSLNQAMDLSSVTQHHKTLRSDPRLLRISAQKIKAILSSDSDELALIAKLSEQFDLAHHPYFNLQTLLQTDPKTLSGRDTKEAHLLFLTWALKLQIWARSGKLQGLSFDKTSPFAEWDLAYQRAIRTALELADNDRIRDLYLISLPGVGTFSDEEKNLLLQRAKPLAETFTPTSGFELSALLNPHIPQDSTLITGLSALSVAPLNRKLAETHPLIYVTHPSPNPASQPWALHELFQTFSLLEKERNTSEDPSKIPNTYFGTDSEAADAAQREFLNTLPQITEYSRNALSKPGSELDKTLLSAQLLSNQMRSGDWDGLLGTLNQLPDPKGIHNSIAQTPSFDAYLDHTFSERFRYWIQPPRFNLFYQTLPMETRQASVEIFQKDPAWSQLQFNPEKMESDLLSQGVPVDRVKTILADHSKLPFNLELQFRGFIGLKISQSFELPAEKTDKDKISLFFIDAMDAELMSAGFPKTLRDQIRQIFKNVEGFGELGPGGAVILQVPLLQKIVSVLETLLENPERDLGAPTFEIERRKKLKWWLQRVSFHESVEKILSQSLSDAEWTQLSYRLKARLPLTLLRNFVEEFNLDASHSKEWSKELAAKTLSHRFDGPQSDLSRIFSETVANDLVTTLQEELAPFQSDSLFRLLKHIDFGQNRASVLRQVIHLSGHSLNVLHPFQTQSQQDLLDATAQGIREHIQKAA